MSFKPVSLVRLPRFEGVVGGSTESEHEPASESLEALSVVTSVAEPSGTDRILETVNRFPISVMPKKN